MYIECYRQLHGKFNEIEDLVKMPSWRGQTFQRFMKANFLTKEDI